MKWWENRIHGKYNNYDLRWSFWFLYDIQKTILKLFLLFVKYFTEEFKNKTITSIKTMGKCQMLYVKDEKYNLKQTYDNTLKRHSI